MTRSSDIAPVYHTSQDAGKEGDVRLLQTLVQNVQEDEVHIVYFWSIDHLGDKQSTL